MSTIGEIEEFKMELEEEIAKSFVKKWKEFSRTRDILSTGNYDLE